MLNEEQEAFQSQKEEYLVYSFTEHEEQPRQYKPIDINKPKISLQLEPIATVSNQSRDNAKPKQPRKYIESDASIRLFNRNFSSGNLQSVKVTEDGTYRLRVSYDCNSRRQSQWFYFSCKGIRKANFEIAGFVKTDSLYNYGMKICVKENGIWHRGGTDISYIKDEEDEGYCLKFTYRFKNPSNKTYFAYSFPYTCQNLQNSLSQIEQRKLLYYSSEILTKTPLKNDLHCLTIGSTDKEVIVISARTHPGQTVSSHILQGFLNNLLSNTPEAIMLRQRYQFKIVPMVNPDGVTLGNYRLSYTGSDLNRKWRDTSSKLHPEVYNLKKMYMRLNRLYGIRMMIDLHGHSRKKGVFFYGCKPSKDQDPGCTKQFPYIMSRIHPAYKYEHCSFAMQKSKEGTQRIAMNNYLKLPYIYTLQASFCGNEGTNQNYIMADYIRIGQKLMDGLLIYLSEQISRSGSANKQAVQKIKQMKAGFKEQLNNNQSLMMVGQNNSDGSSSAPSEGCYRQEEILGLIKLDHFVPAGANLASTRRQNSMESDNYRPLTTQKKHINRSPQFFPSECKVNLINGSLFDKSQSCQNDKLELIDRNKRQGPVVLIINQPKKQEVKQEQVQQYVQVPQSVKQKRRIVEETKKASEVKRAALSFHESSVDLPAKYIKVTSIQEQRIKPIFNRPNDSKIEMKIISPAFFPRRSNIVCEPDRQKRSQTLCLSGFNRSIKAKEYWDEKKEQKKVMHINMGRRTIVKAPLQF